MIEFVRTHWVVGFVCIVTCPPMLLGFLPTFVLRVGLLFYPKDHPRRAEFIAELATIPWRERPKWVAGMLPHCLFEGPSARLRQRRALKVEKEARQSLSLALEQGGSVLAIIVTKDFMDMQRREENTVQKLRRWLRRDDR
ncbi:hypothetical protein [Actinophytocola sp.]|uniref:hypothetical protein n=1 Tax=Actinophytocola sp. TaxID=1872138 RepID=UPI002D2632A5|nr:hypothetical protein [Actinophytocola sp.]HYQ69075.1 hypothetical protein [Actinophytocola sp.]